jgi:hypothetical protein
MLRQCSGNFASNSNQFAAIKSKIELPEDLEWQVAFPQFLKLELRVPKARSSYLLESVGPFAQRPFREDTRHGDCQRSRT